MARQPFRCYSALRNRRIERSLAEPALLASPSFLASSSGAGRAAACALTTRTASIVPLRFARRFRVLRHVRGEGVHGKALSRHADVPDRADDLAAGLRCACQGSVQHAGAAGRSTERALWPTRHTAPRSVLAHLRRGGQKSAGAASCAGAARCSPGSSLPPRQCAACSTSSSRWPSTRRAPSPQARSCLRHSCCLPAWRRAARHALHDPPWTCTAHPDTPPVPARDRRVCMHGLAAAPARLLPRRVLDGVHTRLCTRRGKCCRATARRLCGVLAPLMAVSAGVPSAPGAGLPGAMRRRGGRARSDDPQAAHEPQALLRKTARIG